MLANLKFNKDIVLAETLWSYTVQLGQLQLSIYSAAKQLGNNRQKNPPDHS